MKKKKGNMRKLHRSEDTKEIQWINAIWYPWLDPGTPKDIGG